MTEKNVKTDKTLTCGFGVPNTAMPHHFYVEIPSGRLDPVEIWEDFGAVQVGNNNEKICRVTVDREIWRKIARGIEQYLKRRLKEKSLKVSRFTVGKNKIERLLGREICVLAWAIEDVPVDKAWVAYTHWLSYRPEELWWLFQQIEREGGQWDGQKSGWRLAIRQALAKDCESGMIHSRLNRTIPGLNEKSLNK